MGKQMYSLRELYRIGYGPSSSHTIGVGNAAELFKEHNQKANNFVVTLYESLALTGIGHGTDAVLRNTLSPCTIKIIFDETTKVPHPNTMDFVALKDDKEIGNARYFSLGGGAIQKEGDEPIKGIYPLTTFAEIEEYCKNKKLRLFDYVYKIEDKEIKQYLGRVWAQMKQSVANGIATDGILPGDLNVVREAKRLYDRICTRKKGDECNRLCKMGECQTKENRLVSAYAYAVAEENANGGRVVTSPTCGACGVVPAVLLYLQQKHNFSDEQIINALATGGLIGNLVKANASISGAECGCQAEIGTACSMAAAAVAELFELPIERIEYAASIGMEHHLGLTCDPVKGLVQIPCIERNAVAATRALHAVTLADMLSDTRKISFDQVVATMYQTGLDMHSDYRETSLGGLAKIYSVGS